MSEFSLKQVHLNPAVTILEVDNPQASARISLFGGQILGFKPVHDARERLFLSKTARLDGSKSIRGGIPICWPWFGAHATDSSKPAHGFARNIVWRLSALKNDMHGTRLLLSPESIPDTWWAARSSLELEIQIGDQLCVTLITRNISSSPLPFSAALHSYFSVNAVSDVVLTGLTGTYSDKTRNWQHFKSPSPYFIQGETDRIHLESAARVCIKEANTCTTVTSCGHDSIVVWNPWTSCAEQFTDMQADSYRHMLCVETALTQGFVLPAGETHQLQQVVD